MSLKRIIIAFLSAALVIFVLWFFYHKDKYNHSAEITKQYKSFSSFQADSLTDLPLLRFEAKVSRKNFFVIFIPGDGGWRDVIKTISKDLAKKGINVVGINSIPYFSKEKTAAQVAKDIQRIIVNFSQVWKTDSVIIGGYSFGAEIMPFVYNELDSQFKQKVKKILLIGPTEFADFKVNPVYYYNSKYSKLVLPELLKIEPFKTLTICDKSKESIYSQLKKFNNYPIISVPYGHQFTGHFKDISKIISKRLVAL
jgi:type IV secretory pathway VirJ component